MPAFAPDDEDDENDDADHRKDDTDEQVDALENMKEDAEKQSEIDTTKVDVEPSLFGELPEGRIEEITSDSVSCATAQEVHEWKRQVDLIILTDACPHCDGPIKTYNADARNDDTTEYACQDCGEAWITRAD